MPESFHSAVAPALERYSEPLAGLLALGEVETADYPAWADRLRDHVPDLIRMVLDDDLNDRDQDDPAVWAPLHALEVLTVLAPAEAAGPLTVCLADTEGWSDDLVWRFYAAVGPTALPILQAYLEDDSHRITARARASNALTAIAEAHPAALQGIVDYLIAFLDRPDADKNADEETVTAFVIGDLGDLKAESAYEAIRRAYAADRVDPQIIGLEDVERDFGMRPPIDYSKLAQKRPEPGVHLTLKCKVCGRERPYTFPKVYYDLGTARDDVKRAKYDPVVIPQHVTCSKCGAVDQYVMGPMSALAVTLSLLPESKRGLPNPIPRDQRVQPIEFTARWGPMHPQEAIARYEAEILRQPDAAELRVGYGNVLKFIGHWDEAEAAYRQAVALAPDDPEGWICLAQVAGAQRDLPAAISHWEKVLEVLPRSPQNAAQRQDMGQIARDSLAELRRGIVPEFAPPVRGPGQPRVSAFGAPGGGKVGRNEPCPCGSGKKYKHCHGRKGA